MMDQPARTPDFMIVGAPKCATSSLHLLLLQHPDIFMCDPKEPHFFCTDLPGLAEVPDAAGYDALFAAAPAEATWGEASALYLFSRDAAQNIHTSNPDTKIILSIRNPADAAFSWYHQLRDGFREDQADFAAAWDLQEARAGGQHLPSYCPEPAQLQYGPVYAYHDQIKRYFDVFGRDAVKVLRVEDIKADPQKVIAELLTFIGVDPFAETVDLPRTNTRRKARFPGLNQFLTSPPAVLRPLMTPLKRGLNLIGLKPSVIMMKHLNQKTDAAETRLDPDMRVRLVDYFAADIARLETLLDQDLSSWRS
jgi:hypothetical protein